MSNNITQKNKQPKVSIITPSLNQGLFIEETILSVLNQSYSNIEYIIIDGGSTDNTLEIIQKYDSKINFWVSESDNGQTHAINKGFAKATGDIISWLNSDDLLDKNGVQNIVNAFSQHKNIDFIFGKRMVLALNGSIQINEPKDAKTLYLEYFGSFPYSQPSCYYKRTVLEKVGFLDESFQYTMDLDFFLRIALHCTMKYIDKPVALYREQKDAKTFEYNDTWDYERNKVISKLINSFKYEKGISLLKTFGVFVKPNSNYSYLPRLSEEELEKVVAMFFRDSIHFFYNVHWYKKTYFFSKKVKQHLPQYFSGKMVFYHKRSKWYRYKFIFIMTRPLAVLKNDIIS